ncbi:PDZ domain-containing protein [bacterium]|nr:PDZ domain-containing protein [bacterium]
MRFFIACMALALSTNLASSENEMRRGFEVKLIRTQQGFKHPQYAIVTKVYCESSAKRAGLLYGDILWRIDGKPVDSMSDAEFIVAIARIEQIPWLVISVRRGTEHGPVQKVIHFPPRTGGYDCPEQDI